MTDEDILAQRIKQGVIKNRMVCIPLVDLAQNMDALRAVLDGAIEQLQKARAELDVLNNPWHIRVLQADMYVQFANKEGAERVEEENRKKRENPLGRIIPMKR